jgi:hypothetical protein
VSRQMKHTEQNTTSRKVGGSRRRGLGNSAKSGSDAENMPDSHSAEVADLSALALVLRRIADDLPALDAKERERAIALGYVSEGDAVWPEQGLPRGDELTESGEALLRQLEGRAAVTVCSRCDRKAYVNVSGEPRCDWHATDSLPLALRRRVARRVPWFASLAGDW